MDSQPWLGGDLLLRLNEQQCLWLGGTSLVCSQLANVYLKDKCYLCFLYNFILLCIYLSLRYVFIMCMSVGYL
jgi:hypothetical protein